MPFDEGLAERVRDLVRAEPSMSERKMFGGLCFLSSGNMSFGVLGDEIMVRVGPDAYVEALQLPHVREMDVTGRSMRGMVYVDSEGISEDAALQSCLLRAWPMPARFRPSPDEADASRSQPSGAVS